MTHHLISRSAAAAMVDQLDQRNPTLSILLEDTASRVGSPMDVDEVRTRISDMLRGDDADAIERCRPHVAAIRSTSVDIHLIRDCGVDPVIATFLVSTMGRVKPLSPDGVEMMIIGGKGNPMTEISVDKTLGAAGSWYSSRRSRGVSIDALPSTVVSVIRTRIDDGLPLRDVVSHPVLDGYDLKVETVQEFMTGSTVMTLGNPDGDWRPLEDILAQETRR